MKLEKFTKNKKQKRIVIGSIVGILLIIGGITLYKTFALYKVEKSFDILEGKVPDFRSDVMLALTVNGKAVEEFPKQDSTTYAIKVNCDKGTGVWNRETWGLEIKNIEKNKVKCNVEFTTLTGNQTFDFDYKGKEDAISLPKGKYRLEVWGAQGGHNETTKATGGLGGYSKGEITLTTNDILYINVGGQGEGSSERNEGDTIYKGG